MPVYWVSKPFEKKEVKEVIHIEKGMSGMFIHE